MIQRNGLTLKLFSECNMSCSYCIQKTQEKHDYIDLRNTLRDHFSKYRYKTISIMGGESLLIPKYVIQLVLIIKELTPETSVSVMTNGTCLTSRLVNFFNENGIHIALSINSMNGGEKSLGKATDMASAGPGIVKLIREINSLGIRKVVPLDEGEFAAEVSLLKQLIEPKYIHVSPDLTTLGEFGAKHLAGFEASLDKLYHWYGGDLDWLVVAGLERDYCDCSQAFIMNPDGTMTTLANVQGNHNVVEGCSLFYNDMGDKNYALYRKILTRYFTK